MRRLSEFDRTPLKNIEDVLRRVLEDVVAETILSCLEGKKNLRKEEIRQNPEALDSVLTELLGEGAPVMERFMIKDLVSALKLEYELNPELAFPDHI
jgi:hypothetical protein